MTQSSSLPWWRTDEYDGEQALPSVFEDVAGPKGVALVRAWQDGRTDPGWGLQSPSGEGFMPRYGRGEFNGKRVLFGYEHDRWAFAVVMRSVPIVCIDIDGKNGGLEHAKRLGMLPPTLAETSKSGNGYHLFYLVDDEWDPQLGFGLLGDRIGIETGVDIRATGCVYHHKQQRWNSRELTELPEHLLDSLKHKQQKIAAQNARITTVLANEDPMEVLMMHDQMLSDLQAPIPQGKRNNTLFAIGSQMKLGQYPDWQTVVAQRASDVGLDQTVVDTLISNIDRYATVTP